MIAKICEKAGISEAEIQLKIDEKQKQLSGLVSKEGACHIIANELGIKLLENTGKLKDVYAGMRNVEVTGKVTQLFEVRDFIRADGSSGKVGSFIVGDETGTLRIVCWGSHADTIPKIKIGDVIRITGGLVRENRGFREVHLNEQSRMIINPEGATITEVKKPEPAIRKQLKDLKEGDENIEVVGTIVQVFEPKFFEICPECNARLKNESGNFICDRHSKVNPDYGYVLNLFLDDGTESTRCVLFKTQIQKLTGKKHEELLAYRLNPEAFEPIKTTLLGEQYKFTGRVKKNAFFDRIEFNVNQVSPASPDEELQRLKEEKAE